MPVLFSACMALVASFYQLPPGALPAIQLVEGGRPGLVSNNANGTSDLGVMQINTIWIEPLARHTGLSREIVRKRLIHDPCFNIASAGAILRLHLNETSGNTMRAIGNYHSRTPIRNRDYQARVLTAARRLTKQ